MHVRRHLAIVDVVPSFAYLGSPAFVGMFFLVDQLYCAW